MEDYYYYNYAGQPQGHHPHNGGVVVGAMSVPMGDMWVWDQFFRGERERRRRIYEFMKGQLRHHILHASRKSLEDAVLISLRKGSLVVSRSFFRRSVRVVVASAENRRGCLVAPRRSRGKCMLLLTLLCK